MPLIALAAGVAFLIVFAIALTPLSLVLRYRAGTARRAARGWIVTTNVVGLAASTLLFLVAAAVTTTWIPDALTYTVAGLATGCALGLLGLAASRWEATPGHLYYTPNRWLVLGITLVVTARLLYGFWRAWHSWQAGAAEGWFAAAGVAGSMAAGAVVLGYYLTYWVGVRRRLRGHRRTGSR